MSKFHNKGIEAPDKVLDELKKNIGEYKAYIHQQIERLLDKIVSREDEICEKVDINKTGISNLNDNFSSLNGVLYEIKSLAEKNKDELGSLDAYQKELDEMKASLRDLSKHTSMGLSKNLEDCENQISETRRLFRELGLSVDKNRESSLGLFKEVTDLRKYAEGLDESIGIESNQLSNLKKSFDLCEVSYQDLYRDFKELSEKFVVFSKESDRKINGLEDKCNSLSEEMKEMQTLIRCSSTAKEFLELKEIVDLIPKGTRREDISSDWRHQMELKISRMEKKLNKQG